MVRQKYRNEHSIWNYQSSILVNGNSLIFWRNRRQSIFIYFLSFSQPKYSSTTNTTAAQPTLQPPTEKELKNSTLKRFPKNRTVFLSFKNKTVFPGKKKNSFQKKTIFENSFRFLFKNKKFFQFFWHLKISFENKNCFWRKLKTENCFLRAIYVLTFWRK